MQVKFLNSHGSKLSSGETPVKYALETKNSAKALSFSICANFDIVTR